MKNGKRDSDDPMQLSLDRVRERYEKYRPEVLAALRAKARAYALQHGTVSSNDIRSTLVELGYEGDPRIMGQVFREKGWEVERLEVATYEHSHAGPIIRRWRLKAAA